AAPACAGLPVLVDLRSGRSLAAPTDADAACDSRAARVLLVRDQSGFAAHAGLLGRVRDGELARSVMRKRAERVVTNVRRSGSRDVGGRPGQQLNTGGTSKWSG